jgi:hypothetical protein
MGLAERDSPARSRYHQGWCEIVHESAEIATKRSVLVNNDEVIDNLTVIV